MLIKNRECTKWKGPKGTTFSAGQTKIKKTKKSGQGTNKKKIDRT